jgi:hypothetical protein
VTVPAGTKLTIKTSEAVSTSSHQAGSKFKAALETDLVVNGVVAAPKGTEVYGKVLESSGGRRVGVQRLVVTFSDLSINNQMVPIVTDDAGAEGGRGGWCRRSIARGWNSYSSASRNLGRGQSQTSGNGV